MYIYSGILYYEKIIKIITAYRKKALVHHPDKNIDKDTSEIFLLISKALEILTDDVARHAFDRVIKAKEARELRHKTLDERRKKFKANLESREKAFENSKNDIQQCHKKAEERFQAEIDRIRKEGSELRKAEEERIKKKIHLQSSISTGNSNKYDIEQTNTHEHIFKVQWQKLFHMLADDHELSSQHLVDIFEHSFNQLNKINCLISPAHNFNVIMSGKNRQTALLEVSMDYSLSSNHITTLNQYLSTLKNRDTNDYYKMLSELKHSNLSNNDKLNTCINEIEIFKATLPFLHHYDINIKHIKTTTIQKNGKSLPLNLKNRQNIDEPKIYKTIGPDINPDPSQILLPDSAYILKDQMHNSMGGLDLESFILQRLRDVQSKKDGE
ncbi:dnaJ homolog subfamily C member 17-like isoform X2 [Gordionus sp. m RMFG-2023]|uniref:dnaJ homolog subfamily C member 17-like isoform X2 n=1 Tax=Gordionus sp. m RMFG-2023 TaxID=3053472 RepID=UPI0031FC6BDF